MSLIHYISHNFSDWDSQTKHMSRVEVSLFLDLRTMYFANATSNNGKIDASDFELLCWELACASDDEVEALKRLLKAKFKKVGKSYRHKGWDTQIKNIMYAIKTGKYGNEFGNTGGNGDGNEVGNAGNAGGNDISNAKSNAERQAKAKAERKRLLVELSDIDINPNKNMGIAELRELHAKYFGGQNGNTGGNNIGNAGNGDGNEVGNAGNAQKPSNKHKPLTINHKPLTKESESTPPPTQTHFADKKTSNPSVNKQTSSAKKSTSSVKQKFDPKTYPLEDTVDYGLWCDFVDMRKSIKKPLTEYACRLLVKDFKAWIDEGLSPNKALGESIKNSYPGVFKERAVIDVPKSTLANQKPQFGGKDDPMAVNRRWENYQPPANWEENFKKAMAMVASPSKQSQNATGVPTSSSFGQNGTKVPPSDFNANLGHSDANLSTKPTGLIHL